MREAPGEGGPGDDKESASRSYFWSRPSLSGRTGLGFPYHGQAKFPFNLSTGPGQFEIIVIPLEPEAKGAGTGGGTTAHFLPKTLTARFNNVSQRSSEYI